jgi:hypothetical protein
MRPSPNKYPIQRSTPAIQAKPMLTPSIQQKPIMNQQIGPRIQQTQMNKPTLITNSPFNERNRFPNNPIVYTNPSNIENGKQFVQSIQTNYPKTIASTSKVNYGPATQRTLTRYEAEKIYGNNLRI